MGMSVDFRFRGLSSGVVDWCVIVVLVSGLVHTCSL